MSTGRWRFSDDDVAPGLIFIALAALACITPAQNDTFWHLRSGQEMWQTGRWLLREPFSHTAYGAELHNHWWLSQLAFYAAYSLGGRFLLTAFAGACAVAAVFGSWRLMKGSWELRVALLAWLVAVTAPEWAIRPQVISLALLVLMAHLIVHHRFAWLPAVCLVWANAHAMVVFGVALSGAVALEALLWSRKELKRSLAIAGASLLAPLLSPLGPSYWYQIFATVSVSRELQIQEYQMPLRADDLPFWIAVTVLLVLVVLQRKKVRDLPRADRILLTGATILAIAGATAGRNIAFFAVLAAPVISRMWPSAPDGRQRDSPPAGKAAWGMVAIALAAAVVWVTVVWRGDGSRLGWQPMSAATLDAVRRCPDPIFNEMRDGGVLMWELPGRRVFIDSRMEAYPVDLLRRSREADLRGDYVQLFRDYRIRCAVTTSDSLLRQRLASDPSMRIIQSDEHRTVFEVQS